MMRSLYSAISGLKNHQIRMDVVGDNIANVNTSGFKRSRVSFGTMLSQTTKGASSPTTSPERGGTNAIQIGLGATIGSVDKITTQGSAQYTGQDTDMMLQGSGYFVLLNGSTQVYTRAGGFGRDSMGNLEDPATGALVQGFTPDATTGAIDPTGAYGKITINLKDDAKYGVQYTYTDSTGTHTDIIPAKYLSLESFTIDQSGVITGVYNYDPNKVTPADASRPYAPKSVSAKIGQIAVATFSNDAGLVNAGNNFLMETNNSGTPSIGAPGTGGRALVIPNNLEMSNVDLSQEMTDMIVTQRGFQANSRVITVSDTLLEELINLKR